MKNCPYIKSKREFVRNRRKSLKIAKKAVDDLSRGCAINAIYGKRTNQMMSAITNINDAIRCIDEITKKIA